MYDMKKIDTNSGYDYKKLFSSSKNKECLETVGKDEDGNYILHISSDDKSEKTDEYYVLTDEEYDGYLDKARKEHLVSIFAYGRLERKNKPPFSEKKITDFEIITLHTSGMRGSYEHEIVLKGEEAEVSFYGIRYTNKEDKRVLEKRASCPADEIIDVLNKCRVLSWDGFYGPHPKGVLDGIMFRFSAVVNGGRKISAHGSQNFPKHYRDFTDFLYNILNGK